MIETIFYVLKTYYPFLAGNTAMGVSMLESENAEEVDAKAGKRHVHEFAAVDGGRCAQALQRLHEHEEWDGGQEEAVDEAGEYFDAAEAVREDAGRFPVADDGCGQAHH